MFSYGLLHMDKAGLAGQQVYQLCVDTGYSLEGQPGAIDKEDGWRESVNSLLSARLDDDDDDEGLNSITIVILQEWLLHWITHEDWYAMKNKERNQIDDVSYNV